MYPQHGWVQLYWGGRRPGSLDFYLGAAAPLITDGYSNFAEIERPKRRSVVEYTGTNLYKMKIEGLFDRWIAGQSVENLCVRLERLARPVEASTPRIPQRFKILGPAPHKNLSWYIAGLEWGDSIYEQNRRVRQAFTLDLIEVQNMPAVIGNERFADLRRWRTVTSKTGDLRELAQLMLGNSTLWRTMRNTKGRPFKDWKQKKGVRVRVPG